MTYSETHGYILVKRHWTMLLFNYLSFILLFFGAIFLTFIAVYFQKTLTYMVIEFFMFPTIFLVLQFAFFKFIFDYIQYAGNMIILDNEHIIVIKTTLIDTDNIEFIDLDTVTKIDTRMEGVVHNFLSFGDLMIEQNRDRLRTFNYIHKPYKLSTCIKEKKVNVRGEKKHII